MTLIVNGVQQEIVASKSLTAFLAEHAPPPPFAIAHNGDFIPSSEYEGCVLSDGDSLEIVHASAGG